MCLDENFFITLHPSVPLVMEDLKHEFENVENLLDHLPSDSCLHFILEMNNKTYLLKMKACGSQLCFEVEAQHKDITEVFKDIYSNAKLKIDQWLGQRKMPETEEA